MRKKPRKRSKIELRNDRAKGYLLDGRIPQLADANLGELMEICRHVDLPAHRGMGADDVMSLLNGEGTSEKSQVDKVRETMRTFLQMYWKRVSRQFADGCDGDCWKCSDGKVVVCFLDNTNKIFS